MGSLLIALICFSLLACRNCCGFGGCWSNWDFDCTNPLHSSWQPEHSRLSVEVEWCGVIDLSDEDKKSYVLLSETEDLSDVLSMVRLAETSESYVHRFVLWGFWWLRIRQLCLVIWRVYLQLWIERECWVLPLEQLKAVILPISYVLRCEDSMYSSWGLGGCVSVSYVSWFEKSMYSFELRGSVEFCCLSN